MTRTSEQINVDQNKLLKLSTTLSFYLISHLICFVVCVVEKLYKLISFILYHTYVRKSSMNCKNVSSDFPTGHIFIFLCDINNFFPACTCMSQFSHDSPRCCKMISIQPISHVLTYFCFIIQ